MKRQYDKQEITRILEKFMTGETSLEEEKMLAQYFRTHAVGDEWQKYKEMFHQDFIPLHVEEIDIASSELRRDIYNRNLLKQYVPQKALNYIYTAYSDYHYILYLIDY